MRRVLLTALLGVVLGVTPAVAADQEAALAALTPTLALAATALAAPDAALSAPAAAPRPTIARAARPAFRRPQRPLVLPALYVGSAVLQAYDAYSTLSVLQAGGVEANPVMKTVVKSPVAFIVMKAGVTAFSVAAAERLWKDHNRVGAIVAMAVSNGFMTYVAAHNARVLGRLR